jgi:hypothetical protein
VCSGIETENNSVMRQEKISALMCVKMEETKGREKGRKTRPERREEVQK